jgi:hypothetical protein
MANSTNQRHWDPQRMTSGSSEAFINSFVNELSFWGPTMAEDEHKQQQAAQKQSEEEALRRNYSSVSSTSTDQAPSRGNSSRNNSSRSSHRERSNSNKSPEPQAEPVNWKTAVDPVSGRTYFYDSITRKTQWEKVRV